MPCVFVENQKVAGLDPSDPITVSYGSEIGGFPTGTAHPELLKVSADLQHSNTIVNGVSRIGFMKGGRNALWTDEDFPFVLDRKAKSFIDENKSNPFFLYLAFHDIHVPRQPNEKFVGASTMGARGDAIAQMDWCVGEVVKHLEAWLGRSEKGREFMLEEAYTYALRKGGWKYIQPQTGTTPDWMKNKKVESGLSNEIQLYNLKEDIREERNVAAGYPEIVAEMREKLESILQER